MYGSNNPSEVYLVGMFVTLAHDRIGDIQYAPIR